MDNFKRGFMTCAAFVFICLGLVGCGEGGDSASKFSVADVKDELRQKYWVGFQEASSYLAFSERGSQKYALVVYMFDVSGGFTLSEFMLINLDDGATVVKELSEPADGENTPGFTGSHVTLFDKDGEKYEFVFTKDAEIPLEASLLGTPYRAVDELDPDVASVFDSAGAYLEANATLLDDQGDPVLAFDFDNGKITAHGQAVAALGATPLDIALYHGGEYPPVSMVFARARDKTRYRLTLYPRKSMEIERALPGQGFTDGVLMTIKLAPASGEE